MLDQKTINELALKLHEAETSRMQTKQFSLCFPDIDISDAYAIQKTWVERKIKDGKKLIGHKIGLTSRAMQMASQINEPDYGSLLDDMLFLNGSTIPTNRFIAPRVEVELAFILGKKLVGPNITLVNVLDAVKYVMPALEIIDARSHQIDPETQTPRKVFDTIADNAANAGLITGGRVVRVNEFDLRWVGAILSRNSIVEETGIAAGVLNHPANGVVWLANKLANHGASLEADQIILSGSFTRPVYAKSGDTFFADYGNLGTVSCYFE